MSYRIKVYRNDRSVAFDTSLNMLACIEKAEVAVPLSWSGFPVYYTLKNRFNPACDTLIVASGLEFNRAGQIVTILGYLVDDLNINGTAIIYHMRQTQ